MPVACREDSTTACSYWFMSRESTGNTLWEKTALASSYDEHATSKQASKQTGRMQAVWLLVVTAVLCGPLASVDATCKTPWKHCGEASEGRLCSVFYVRTHTLYVSTTGSTDIKIGNMIVENCCDNKPCKMELKEHDLLLHLHSRYTYMCCTPSFHPRQQLIGLKSTFTVVNSKIILFQSNTTEQKSRTIIYTTAALEVPLICPHTRLQILLERKQCTGLANLATPS